MNQHETPRGSQVETGRRESYGATAAGAAEGRDAESQRGIGGRQGGSAGGHEGHRTLPKPVWDDIGQDVRNQPLPALLIAAGLGYLIGRRARPRRSVAALSHVGAHWPPRFETPRSPEAGVSVPAATTVTQRGRA